VHPPLMGTADLYDLAVPRAGHLPGRIADLLD
jgi:hypothetical protein